ncbi:MAG TPA: 30S ribosome-binding factor RbfA [Gemmatimonadales bacterium]|nr:30S ribosome-binding factor RbfA [Gemmatimonadales bacterium]HEU5358516.1 30S ribosome-binding factor RbfA [Gemmatimonadales bacterium]
MKGSSRRPEQVGETIRQVVADALMRGEVRDPRIGLVTVTRVEVSGDLSHAKVYVSPQGDDAERARAMEGLESAAGYLRSLVARVLTTRSVPELHLEQDRGLEHAARIEQLLADLRREEQG